MMTLPKYSHGQYNVGLSTWVVPVTSRVIGSAKTRSRESKPALEIRQVTFNIFYPCEANPKQSSMGIPWLPRPLSEWAKGYSAFLNISRWLLFPFVYLIGSLVKIPAWQSPPLLPARKSAATIEKWPLVIFSHGLAGSRFTYSDFCGNLAADGRIVIAMEHWDGTGPAVFGEVGGKLTNMYYSRFEDFDWPESQSDSPMPLRSDQLQFRHIEVLEAFKAFIMVTQGVNSNVKCSEANESYWMSWKDQVQTDKLCYAGHSFGACTALHILSANTPTPFIRLPVIQAVLLDPWLEPLPSPIPNPLDEYGIPGQDIEPVFNLPILVINSEAFTVWSPHFVRLEELFSAWTINSPSEKPIFFTLARSVHSAFSDFSLLLQKRHQGRQILDTIHNLTSSFMYGKLDGYLKEISEKLVKDFVVDFPDDKKKKQIRAKFGDIIVHSRKDISTAG